MLFPWMISENFTSVVKTLSLWTRSNPGQNPYLESKVVKFIGLQSMNPLHLTSVYADSLFWSVYISLGANKENLFNNQELL